MVAAAAAGIPRAVVPVEMILEVRWCGRSYSVQVALSARVGELKIWIRDATGLPTKRQNLLWPDVASALQDDAVLLSALPFNDKSTVTLISDLCEIVKSLLMEGICPRKVCESNLYLKLLDGKPRLKVLIDDVERLKENVDMQKKQVADLWSQISNMIFSSVKRCHVYPLNINSKGFCEFIGKQSIGLIGKPAIKKLEAYPDNWDYAAKGAYLIQLVAADKSLIWRVINDSGLKWPKNDNGDLPAELDALIRGAAVIGISYRDDDPYDYIRLFRNGFKKFGTLLPELKAEFYNEEGLIRRFEKWTPNIWCLIYEAVGPLS